jgi:hypothetical protein
MYSSSTAVLPISDPGEVPVALDSWDPASFAFLGTDRQYVEFSSSHPDFALVQPANDFSISVWYRANTTDVDSGGSELISMGDYYILRLGKFGSDFRLEFNKRFTETVGTSWAQCFYNDDPTGSSFLGAWHHLAGTQSTSGMALYLDGVELPCDFLNNAGESASDVVYAGGGEHFRVGRHGGSSAGVDFQGNLDDVRIYARVLSPADVAALASVSE